MLTSQAPGRVSVKDPANEARERVWFAALVTIAIFKLWILPLQNGFWLDETGTFWAIQGGGVLGTIHRTLIWPSQILVYSVIAWCSSHLGGSRELALRLPSLIGMMVGAYLLYRLAARLMGTEAARAATVVFICSEAVAFAAGDARPYALGTMAIIAAGWFLVRWFDRGKVTDAIAFGAFAGFIIEMHYVLGTALAVFAIYAWIRARRGELPRIGQIFVAAVVFLVFLAPVAPHLRALLSAHQNYFFSGTPGITELFEALISPLLWGSLIAGLGIARLMIVGFELRIPRLETPALVLIVSWTLLPYLALFAVSNVSSLKVFIARYLLAAAPGFAMLIGWVVSAFRPRSAQLVALSMLTLVTLLTTGGLLHPPHGGDWRAATNDVKKLATDPTFPVLIRSGFVESAASIGNPESPEDHFYAPLLAYPTPGRIVRLPYRMDQDQAASLDSVASSVLEPASRFALVTSGDGAYEYWLLGRLSSMGFRIEKTTRYGGKDATLRLITFAKGKSS